MMNRREFAKVAVGLTAGVVGGAKVALAQEEPGHELAAAFVSGARQAGVTSWSRPMEEFGETWIEQRLSRSSADYGTIRQRALDRAEMVGRWSAEYASLDGKSEIQVRHLQLALKRLAPSPLATDCPF